MSIDKPTRRQVLCGGLLTALLGVTAVDSMAALRHVVINTDTRNESQNALVVLFLRGGADGLNIIAPYGDEDYFRLRPSLALASPTNKSTPAAARLLDLDGFFGMHPALLPLLPLYHSGTFLPIHAVGSFDHSLSHFQAMAAMERGLPEDGGDIASGWLARYLNSATAVDRSPLRSVALSATLPDSLRGATGAVALTRLSQFQLSVPTGVGGQQHHSDEREEAMAQTLQRLYGQVGSSAQSRSEDLSTVCNDTLRAMKAVQRLDSDHYMPAVGATYPNTGLAVALKQAACMVKGRVGLEAACINVEGWDTHVAQGSDTGWQASRLADLGGSIAAFMTDLGSNSEHVTVVIMTEFGRRAYENTGLGTDHGSASVMMLLGGGVKGGRVLADWPGLASHQLVGPGNLHVTTDYRDVLAEVLASRMNVANAASLFPGLRRKDVGALQIINPVATA